MRARRAHVGERRGLFVPLSARAGHTWSRHAEATAPRPQDLAKLESDPGAVRAVAYDLIINGSEAGGGTIRIHDQAVQQQVFRLLATATERRIRSTKSQKRFR
jgi:aspartyl-tRNA synthetase